MEFGSFEEGLYFGFGFSLVDGVEDDVDLLVRAGDVLAIHNTEDKTQILFPRGEAFLVELDGIVSLPPKQAKNTAGGASEQKVGEPSSVISAKNGSTPNGDEGKGLAESQPTKEEKVDDDKAPKHTFPSTDPASKIDEIVSVELDVDPRSQIRRGEAVQIGGQWFRVSSAVKEGPLKDQPARAQAPLSVVSIHGLSKRNEVDGYIRPLSERNLPVDLGLSKTTIENIQKGHDARDRLIKLAHGRSCGAASQLFGNHAHASNPATLAASFGTTPITGSRKRPLKSSVRETQKDRKSQGSGVQVREAATDPYLAIYTHARRHGCTKDVRDMYLATREDIPESDAQLKELLVEHKLLEPGEEMRRARLKRKANVDNDGKPKKRRYYERKNQRMTNTHLEGTEIGAVLMRAQEKQRHGETVGDGGM